MNFLPEFIPQEEDFEKVAVAQTKNDLNYATDNFDIIKNLPKLWRRFIVGILFKWEALIVTLQKLLVNSLGCSIEDLKDILAESKKYSNQYMKYYLEFRDMDKTKLKNIATQAGAAGTVQDLADNISVKLTGVEGNVLINTNGGNKDFCRLIAYDTRYSGTGARRHIFFKKKVGDVYLITFGGQGLGDSHDWYDEPLFSSVPMALNFIENLDKVTTRYPIDKFMIKVVNSSIDPGWPNRGKLIQDLSDAVRVNTICGPAYIQRKSRACQESLEEKDMNEAIEKHDTLNPKLFDDMKLKPEIRQKAQDVVNEFLRILAEDEVRLEVRDVILTGSNASYNYTENSDVDLHILAKTKDLNDPDKLYPKIYNCYRRLFEGKFDISFYGIPVEVYVEVEDNPVVSNGIYSVMFDQWVKEPTHDYVKEVDQKEIDAAATPWIERAEKVIKTVDDNLPDGEEEINKYLEDIYAMRQKGIYDTEDSEFSTENLVFKEVRNAGLLDKLKELKNIVIGKKLSLEEAVGYLDDAHEFKDYGTAEVEGGNVIDTTRASTFATQDVLDHSDDAAYEGVVYDIVDLTPAQYFELCGKVQHMDPEEMMEYIKSDERQLAHIKDVILKYHKRLQMPYVSFSKMDEVSGQEGRHRMYALGEMFGWDKEFPVMVIQDLGAKKTIGELLHESINEEFSLSEKERRDYLTQIAQLSHHQPIVHNNGIFEIYNVSEDESMQIVSILSQQKWTEWVQRTAGRFDFSNWKTITGAGIPARLYTIRGKIKIAPVHELVFDR